MFSQRCVQNYRVLHLVYCVHVVGARVAVQRRYSFVRARSELCRSDSYCTYACWSYINVDSLYTHLRSGRRLYVMNLCYVLDYGASLHCAVISRQSIKREGVWCGRLVVWQTIDSMTRSCDVERYNLRHNVLRNVVCIHGILVSNSVTYFGWYQAKCVKQKAQKAVWKHI